MDDILKDIFVNELGNRVLISIQESCIEQTGETRMCITMIGPTSKMTNYITKEEFKRLRNLMNQVEDI